MKRITTTLTILLSVATTFAQNIDDASLFTQTFYQGTAKGLGMGNALGAVGGDMTSLSINPAGMGIYRGDELAMTVGLVDNIHNSTYYGESHSANKWRMSLPNIGYIHTKERSNYRPLRFTQFGITFNRTNDYNVHTYANGLNTNSSRINKVFLSQIEGLHPDDLPNDAYSYWQTFLIDEHLNEGNYSYTTQVPSKVWQKRESDFKGRAEEWNFSGSANFGEKLFVGANFNINHIKRFGVTTYEETRQQTKSDFENWNASEDISTDGWGFNGKLGLIFHANNWLRIGAAFHTPAYYSLNHSWQTITESQFINSGFHSNTMQDKFEYVFIRPLKWVGSLAFVVGQNGIISLDAEYTNYGAAKFKTAAKDNYDYSAHNEAIKNTFGRTLNFRVGSEWRLSNSYLRFGAGYYGSPFGIGEPGGSVKKASVGLSLPAGNHIIFDFAYELSLGQQFIMLYDYNDLLPIEQKQFKNLVMVTLRVR